MGRNVRSKDSNSVLVFLGNSVGLLSRLFLWFYSLIYGVGLVPF